jgi:DNA-binding NarL/FixJ family response regulator
MNPIRILLVDDHHLVRAGLRTLLQQMVGAEVIGEASDGREALEKIKTDPPDVVLMDITMAEMNGLVATAQVTQCASSCSRCMRTKNTSPKRSKPVPQGTS